MHIEIGNIGFDIQQGCAVQDIDILHLQDVSSHTVQFDDRYSNTIGFSGSPGAENTMLFVMV